MRKGLAIAACALMVAFVGVGCGSDDNSSDKGGSDNGGGSAQTQSSKGAKVDTNNPEVRQAIDKCKAQVNTNPQLSDKAKKKVGEVCEKAASGDADAAVKATKEACKIIVEDAAPPGAAKDQALAACDKAGQQ